MIDYISEQKKCGTVTVSVYTDDSNNHFFDIKSDSDDVLPVSYVIEDVSFYIIYLLNLLYY